MDLLADTGRAEGRWIVAPRKGAQFVGARNRARMRARQRRRRVLYFLFEAMGLTFLMALFPPFRPMIYATAVFAGLLVVYVGLLLSLRRNDRELQRMHHQFTAAVQTSNGSVKSRTNGDSNGHPNGRGASQPHVSNGNGHSKATYNGLDVIDDDEVHVVIRGGGHLQSSGVR